MLKRIVFFIYIFWKAISIIVDIRLVTLDDLSMFQVDKKVINKIAEGHTEYMNKSLIKVRHSS